MGVGTGVGETVGDAVTVGAGVGATVGDAVNVGAGVGDALSVALAVGCGVGAGVVDAGVVGAGDGRGVAGGVAGVGAGVGEDAVTEKLTPAALDDAATACAPTAALVGTTNVVWRRPRRSASACGIPAALPSQSS